MFAEFPSKMLAVAAEAIFHLSNLSFFVPVIGPQRNLLGSAVRCEPAVSLSREWRCVAVLNNLISSATADGWIVLPTKVG